MGSLVSTGDWLLLQLQRTKPLCDVLVVYHPKLRAFKTTHLLPKILWVDFGLSWVVLLTGARVIRGFCSARITKMVLPHVGS